MGVVSDRLFKRGLDPADPVYGNPDGRRADQQEPRGKRMEAAGKNGPARWRKPAFRLPIPAGDFFPFHTSGLGIQIGRASGEAANAPRVDQCR